MNDTTVVVAGVDGQKEALRAITDGECEGQYVSTGLKSPSLAAEQSVDIAIKVANGEVTKHSSEAMNDTEPHYFPPCGPSWPSSDVSSAAERLSDLR